MQAREIAIIPRLHKVFKMPILKVAKAVGRHEKSIYRALKTRKVLSRGRAHVLSPSEVRHIITVLKQLVLNAKTSYEVTLSMVKKAAKATVGLKTARGFSGPRKLLPTIELRNGIPLLTFYYEIVHFVPLDCQRLL